jgi:hypothetical protein
MTPPDKALPYHGKVKRLNIAISGDVSREAYLVGDKSVWLMAYSWREWL